MRGAIFLSIGYGLESPPIRRGCRARKIWRYLNRMDRLELRADRWREQGKLSMQLSMEVSGCVIDTMEHLESLGIEFDDYGNWVDRGWCL